MKVGILQFPGSNCDYDAFYAFRDSLGLPTEMVWHKSTSLNGLDAIIVPGGFSFGDYLRCGAIARFSPVMTALKEHAAKGGLVLGICNGFQILCESGLLPGALVRNSGLEFRCMNQSLKVEDSTPAFNPKTIGSANITLPIAHGEGNYRIDNSGLAELKKNKQIILRYSGKNPNGALEDIAGIRNKEGNVFGMMPHPERAIEAIHPSQDGLPVLKAFLNQTLTPA
jgi:phosphoribosylformylglycinamidine synthase subunit PurQ / glutaminase